MAQKFDETFKTEALRLLRTSSLTQREVARDLGVGYSTLARWWRESQTA